ncbi:MAG TPA: hypothetical protein VIY86_08780 [Pirellulaceae bacterium]
MGIRRVFGEHRGVEIYEAPANLVGGTTHGAGNVLSGNGSDGIAVYRAAVAGNVVEANLVGTDVSGVTAIENGFQGVVDTLRPGSLRHPIRGL